MAVPIKGIIDGRAVHQNMVRLLENFERNQKTWNSILNQENIDAKKAIPQLYKSWSDSCRPFDQFADKIQLYKS
jgi:hypothetical protein